MKRQRLSDAYRFTGFIPGHDVQEIVMDAGARTIRLKRRQKKLFVANAEPSGERIMTAQNDWSGICPAATFGYTLRSKCAGYSALGATR